MHNAFCLEFNSSKLDSPTKIWVSSLQSLPLFIRSFQNAFVSVALYDFTTLPEGLGLPSVVSKKLPAFIRRSTNTTIIADCGCPDFPLFLAIGSHEHAYFTQNRKKKQSLFIFIDFFF